MGLTSTAACYVSDHKGSNKAVTYVIPKITDLRTPAVSEQLKMSVFYDVECIAGNGAAWVVYRAMSSMELK